jgi:phosphoglycolate phosphatase
VQLLHLNEHAVQAAILDLDGTLVDTLGDFTIAMNRMAQELRLPAVAADTIETFVGKGTEYLVRSVLERIGAPGQVYDQALQSYLREYKRINGEHAIVYPGVTEGLAGLRSTGLRLACVTNKPVEYARELLAAKQLDGFFEMVFGGDSFERKKPDPLPLLKACEALGTRPPHTLAIGDSSNDALAARAAGCPVVLVSYGYNHGQPVRSIPADAYLDSIAELPARLLSRR